MSKTVVPSGWIGVDLDGTLAYYEGWNNGLIGGPIPVMLARVKQWLAEGHTVKIMTARVYQGSQVRSTAEIEAQRSKIQDWCQKHLGQRLEVTCNKDYAMIQLWDDRCVQVIPNTGELVTDYPYLREHEIAIRWNLHPDEAKPRGETWLHERRNWQQEVEGLRATVAAMEETIKATHLFDEHEELYVMKWTQDRIRIEREIAAWSPEKKAAMDQFIENAHAMTFEQLDAVIGTFGDPEGTYIQRSEAGQAAMKRWVDDFNQQCEETRKNRLDEIRANRDAAHTQRNLDRLTDGPGSGLMK